MNILKRLCVSLCFLFPTIWIPAVVTEAVATEDYTITRLEESVKDVPPVVLPVREEKYVFPPKYIEAGHFPSHVGDVNEGYPVVDNYSERDRKKALSLNYFSGYSDMLNNFIGVRTWIGFLGGKSLAFIHDDLRAAGFDPDKREDVKEGIFELFHIKLTTPGHTATFPQDLKLHIKLIDHDIEYYDKDIVLETVVPLTASGNGDYYFSDPKRTRTTVRDLSDEAHDIAGVTYWGGKGREIKFVKLTGINEESTTVEDMPEIEGVVMTHEIFIGSFQVESGWQWFGRPAGLLFTQQPGFIQ